MEAKVFLNFWKCLKSSSSFSPSLLSFPVSFMHTVPRLRIKQNVRGTDKWVWKNSQQDHLADSWTVCPAQLLKEPVLTLFPSPLANSVFGSLVAELSFSLDNLLISKISPKKCQILNVSSF